MKAEETKYHLWFLSVLCFCSLKYWSSVAYGISYPLTWECPVGATSSASLISNSLIFVSLYPCYCFSILPNLPLSTKSQNAFRMIYRLKNSNLIISNSRVSSHTIYWGTGLDLLRVEIHILALPGWFNSLEISWKHPWWEGGISKLVG